MPKLTPDQIAMINLITTIVLALITGYYAIITHRMLNSQKEMAELEKRPFLKMNSIIFNLYKENESVSKGGIQLGVQLENVSRVLLKYKMTRMEVSIEDIKIEKPLFINYGGYVYPNQITEYTYQVIENIGLTKDVIRGYIKYEMEYFSHKNKKYKSNRHYEVFIYTRNNKLQWKSINEDETEIK